MSCRAPYPVPQRPEPSTSAAPDHKTPPTSALQPAQSLENRLGRYDARQEGIAKSLTIDNVAPMQPVETSCRILTWCCVILLAVLIVVASARYGANRHSRPARAFRCLYRIGDHRDSRVWAQAGYSADHRFILDIRGCFGVSPALFAGPTSVDRRFCGIGARRVHRRAPRDPPPASLVEGCIFGRRLILMRRRKPQ